jgi:hypothetical protein
MEELIRTEHSFLTSTHFKKTKFVGKCVEEIDPLLDIQPLHETV